MDFRATGLPQDPTVFKAFLAYTKNIKDAPQEIQDSAFTLRTARLLAENTPDTSAVQLALLNVVPPEAWGTVERGFGAQMVSLLSDIQRHDVTGYAYIRDAQPAVKQLTLAGAITTFQDFEGAAERLDFQIEQIKMSGQGNLSIPMIPSTEIYDKIGQALLDNSGAPKLEELFAEKLYAFRDAHRAFIDKLESYGMQVPGLTGIGAAPAEVRYPLFEETGLADTPKVRTAYETLINHTRVSPEDFEAALQVGKLLSTASTTQNPTAIAAGLLDVGIRSMNNVDFHFLKDRMDWDVLEVLKVASVYSIQSPAQILAAPVEFRQIALASQIGVIEDAKKGGQHVLDMAAENPDLPKAFVMQNFLALKRIAIMSERAFTPVLGNTDMPELDQMFVDRLKDFKTFTDLHLPKQEAPAPKPVEKKAAPDAPKPGRNGDGNFNL